MLPAGKLTLLVGESGSGKSTLIEVLTHIAPEYHRGAVSGRFLRGGEDLSALSLKEMGERIGLVFQNPENQFCTYTVEDELAFGLENLSVPPPEIETRITELLALFELEPLRRRPLHQLSGGEQQKAAIAAALAAGAPLLILDEPTSNLSPLEAEKVLALIARLKTEKGQTVLMVEHRLEYALDYAEHLIVLANDGNLAFSGSPQEGLAFLRAHDEIKVRTPFAPRLRERPSRERGADVSKVSMETPAIACKQLSLALDGRPVLRGVDLSIARGEIAAIAGPNGAGKTSLAHSLLGLYPQSRGEVFLFGKNLKTYGKRKWQYAGIAFQNPEWQFAADTTEDELAFSLKKSRLPETEKRARIDAALARFGLLQRRSLSPYRLSQGEKRRLSVASVLIRGQQLLILDEPTYGQDQRGQDELLRLVLELNRGGMTIVIITHDMDLVNEYCGRVVVLEAGRVLYDGGTGALFADDELCRRGHLKKPFSMEAP